MQLFILKYQVTDAMIGKKSISLHAKVYAHCLPASRGEEVTDLKC